MFFSVKPFKEWWNEANPFKRKPKVEFIKIQNPKTPTSIEVNYSATRSHRERLRHKRRIINAIARKSRRYNYAHA